MEEAVKPVPPQVSVLIYSRNSEAALRRCLSALEASKGRERFEVLVMDNGSRDGSQQIDAEFPGCTVLRMPRNFGWTRAMNIGMRTAVGEFVFFLDPTVELENGAIPALAAALSAQPEATAVAPFLRDEAGAPAPSIRVLPKPGNVWPEPAAPPAVSEQVAVEFPNSAALLVRKGFIQGMNYIDQRYGHAFADAEICYQIRRAGKKILFVPSAVGVWRSTESLSHDTYEADRVAGAATFLGKHFGFFAGFSFRLGAILRSFLSLRIGLAASMLSGQKIDGTQGND